MVSFCFAGVRWRVSFGFVAGLCAFLLLDRGGFALAFIGAAALHELGHLAAMAALHVPVRLVELCLCRMEIYRGGRAGFAAELAVQLGGVFSNLLFAGLLWLVGGAGALHFSAANTALALFHLLPLRGLDGGSMVELLCVWRLGADRGERMAARLLGLAVAVAAGLLLLWVWQRGLSAGVLLAALLLLCVLLQPAASCGRLKKKQKQCIIERYANKKPP